ncbi:MarR family transcriptional regulator [Brachyspira intermedia]|uniref:MarR family transcriptional regulator n=1 Tax=Brachyspira intermedia TaxID=84377 RepID=UPI003006DB04
MDNNNIELIHRMEDKINNVYKFVKLYNDYITKDRDYGLEEKFNMLSIHILSDIKDNPGITVTELSLKWYRTKGSISQVINFLEKNNYIIRKTNDKNKKIHNFYTTEKGDHANYVHKNYDFENLNNTLETILKKCTEDEIYAFHKVIECYIDILKTK